MKEYIFTELISRQWKEFTIMIFTGASVAVMYRILRAYVFLKLKSGAVSFILELLFFLIAALFTGCVIDFTCASRLTFYMIEGFFIGVMGSALLIRLR